MFTILPISPAAFAGRTLAITPLNSAAQFRALEVPGYAGTNVLNSVGAGQIFSFSNISDVEQTISVYLLKDTSLSCSYFDTTQHTLPARNFSSDLRIGRIVMPAKATQQYIAFNYYCTSNGVYIKTFQRNADGSSNATVYDENPVIFSTAPFWNATFTVGVRVEVEQDRGAELGTVKGVRHFPLQAIYFDGSTTGDMPMNGGRAF